MQVCMIDWNRKDNTLLYNIDLLTFSIPTIQIDIGYNEIIYCISIG